MWDKKETGSQRTQQTPPVARTEGDPAPAAQVTSSGSRGRANIGGSLFIKGEVTGSEDLTVEGRVEGKIDLKDHNLSVAKSGKVNAEIHAKSVTVNGEVSGNVHADEKVEIAESGRVVGDLFAPRVAISDGAQFQGSVDMSGTQAARSVMASAREANRPQPSSQQAGQARGGSGAPVRRDEQKAAVQGKAASQG